MFLMTPGGWTIHHPSPGGGHKNLIYDDSLINIIRLKLISCLYKEDANLFNKEILDIKNKTIVNTVSFEVIIDFL